MKTNLIFNKKGTNENLSLMCKFFTIFQNLSSVLNNEDSFKANYLCNNLSVKLKRRNKLIKMADRSIVGWDTVTKYEIDPIASTSGDEKKIRAAENIALS